MTDTHFYCGAGRHLVKIELLAGRRPTGQRECTVCRTAREARMAEIRKRPR